MAGTARCPKCGLVQLAKGNSCKSCGAALQVTAPLAASSSAQRAAVSLGEAPARPVAARGVAASLDPAFDRDRFLLRQRVLSIHERYDLRDEQGEPILFVERPAHHLKSLGALLAGLAGGALVAGGAIAVAIALEAPMLTVVGLVLGFVALVAVATALGPKRHVLFYRDEARQELLLEVLQDQKFAVLSATFTVRDPQGGALAQFSKNPLTDVFRKKWTVLGTDGRLLCVAREDSLLKALLRRFLSQLIVMNFVFYRADTDEVIGTFNRKFTILDRYVLDLSADPGRILDRRVAVALGVMLDTGERR